MWIIGLDQNHHVGASSTDRRLKQRAHLFVVRGIATNIHIGEQVAVSALADTLHLADQQPAALVKAIDLDTLTLFKGIDLVVDCQPIDAAAVDGQRRLHSPRCRLK